MKSLLDRYVISECLPPFGLSLAVFTFVLLMHRLLGLSDLVITKGVPVTEVLRLLGLALPAVLPLLLPLSLLLSVLLAFGRLSSDSEITAMRAGGVGLGRNLAPVVALSLFTLALTAVVSLWAEPISTRELKDAVYRTVKNRISVTATAGTFTQLSEGITLYAEGMNADTGELKGLFLYLDRPPAKALWILARSGSVRAEPQNLILDLETGEVHQYAGAGSPYRRLFFDRYRVTVPLPAVSGEDPEVEQLPTGEVFRRATAGVKGKATRLARMELHRRLALPFSCLVFGVLGATLGLHHSRAGRSRSVTVCLAVVIAYYVLLTGGRTLGDRGKIEPWLAMWLPNLALGAFAAYAFVRKNRERPLPLEELVGRALAGLRRLLPRPGGRP
ncbi:MAG: LPS export ABC transporter permease LptF [Deltaproteobacteria bacterium]|nr:LPS export ABC transporter permease LptF [Deltaproteobacteria bacterium]